MRPPVDYPVQDDAGIGAFSGPVTYAILLDRYAAEQPITEDMIQSACLSMEAAQQFPFAARPVPINTPRVSRARPDELISRLRKVIR